jgi:hypothetical protein
MVVLALSAVACRRKAPTVAECQAVAIKIVQLTTVRSHGAVAKSIDPANPTVQKLEAECQSAPYDKELLTCINTRATEGPCFREYQARHGETPRTRREKEPD